MDNLLKPREKIKQHGINSLSDAELLAVVLGAGTKSKDVMQIANELLVTFNGLNNLQNVELEELLVVHGIGQVKASTLYAIFEICKRANRQKYYLKKELICKPYQVEELCSEMKSYEQENVVLICLNVKMELIAKERIFVGQLSSVNINPREIFKKAFLRNAYSIILVHNHPSGNAAASDDDLVATSSLVESAKLLEILLIDHIIIANSGYYSIREHHPNLFKR